MGKGVFFTGNICYEGRSFQNTHLDMENYPCNCIKQSAGSATLHELLIH